MKKFFLIVLYTLKHLFKMLFIIGTSWLIGAGIIWFLELLLEIEAGLAFVCFIVLALISVAAMEAHTEVNERLKEQELADESDKERRNRFFMEN